jgi:putative ABC transport system permease protein
MIAYLRTLALFYRRHLRVQPLRELMAVAGVAAGVALLFAVQVAHRSVTGSFEQIAHGVAGEATLELAARGQEGFDQRVAEQVEAMKGVRAAAPIISTQIVAVGPKGKRALTLVGATEQILPLHGELSSQFQRAAESSQRGLLLMTAPSAAAIGVRPGQGVSVQVGGRGERVRLDATLGAKQIGASADSPIAAAPLAIVQNLARLPGRVTRVLIEPRPGREADVLQRLQHRYGPTLNVRPIDTEAKLLGGAAAAERQVTLLFSAISLVAGIILAYNALLLASAERRRFILYLIQSGAPESMVLASLGFDALVLGLAGCALGLIAGDLISLLAFHGLPGYIAAAFPVGPQRIVTAQTLGIALAGGMLAAFAATLLPALAILRSGAVSDGAGLEQAGLARTLSLSRRLSPSDQAVFACGLAIVALSVPAALLYPQVTLGALVALAVGIVMCLPLTARGLLALATRASRRSGDAAARLSVAELRGSPPRTVALLATGTIAAFLMVVIGGSVSDVQSAVRRGAGDLLSSAQLWVKPGGAENVYTTEPFAYEQTQRRLQRLAVVRSALPWRDSFLDLPGRRVWVLAPPPQLAAQIAPSQLQEGSLAIADRRLREGGWVTLSKTIASEQHLRIGDPVRLPTPAGYENFRLAATTANYGWLPGAIVMSGADHARLWAGGGPGEAPVRSSAGGPGATPPRAGGEATQLAVTLAPGVTLARGKRLVQGALPPGSGLSVQSADERRAEVSAVLGSTLSRLSATTIVVIVTTIVSVIALMMAAVWQGRARFNSLISIGMGFGQFARLIFYESGIVLLGGCLIGVAAGLTGQYLIDGWLAHTTGSPVHYAAAWLLGARTLAIALAISLAASLAAVIRINGSQPRAAFSMQ